MKKLIIMIAIAAMLATATLTSSIAVGDKVRGEIGEGPVHQVQIQDPPPFNP